MLCFLIFSSQVFAADTVTVKLADGSIISGEILSMKGGVYSLSSKSLGTVRIKETDIRGIRYGTSGTAADTPSPSEDRPDADIASLQNEMLSNDQILNMILSLQNDPGIQKLLNDPNVLRAVSSGDINALISNPDFMKIVNHATVQSIRNKLMKP